MLLSIATVFYLDIGSEAMAAAVSAGVLLALVFPALPARIPVWAHRLAFPAIVLFFAGDIWITGQLLPAVVRLDLLLLLYRGMSHRARRDDLQIIVLGLFLIVVAGVLTVSLVFAAQILVFTACALGLLMAVTITASAEGGQAPKLAVRGALPLWAAHADWPRLFRRLRAIADWRLVASAVALFLGVIALSGLLFLMIPRFQLENSLFLERFVTKKAMTGFNDSIKFGDVTEITQDDSVAFFVDVSDPAKAPVNPYWRMVVLDQYRNGGFSLSAGMKSRAVFGRERTEANLRTVGRGVRGTPTWTFYLESGVSRYLPLLGRFDMMRFREAQNFRYSPDLALVALRDEPASMTAYRVDGMAPDSSELADPTFAGRWRNRAVPSVLPLQVGLELSRDDRAALAGMVSGVAPAGSDAGTFAQRASVALRRQHPYTLSPRIPAGRGDPLVRWMASREPGHCELFAGALVLMARSAGIPARVVTGFRGGTWNAYSGNYTLRNSDAHAWAEVWDEPRRVWLREDPLAIAAPGSAAEEAGEGALAGRMDRSWSARMSSLRVFWYRRIVNFDQQSQADVLKAVRGASESSSRWLKSEIADAAYAVKAWFRAPWDGGRLLRLAAAAAGAAGLAWLAATGRMRRLHLGRGRRTDPVRREAGRWLVRLEGPAALVADLQRLRFGPAQTWPRPADTFRKARQAARSRRHRRASSQSTS